MAINAYSALNPNKPTLPDGVTLEDAKKIVDEQLWPAGLSDEEERTAWGLIVIKDGIAELTPVSGEAWEAMQASEEPGQNGDENALAYANASNIATAINAYNALNPNSVLPDGIKLEDAKEAVDGQSLWPQGLTDEEARAAWELIVYKDGIAEVKGLY